jgi:signal peptidase I
MKGTGKELLSFGWNVLIVLLLTWVILTYVGQRTSVSGQSMLPMLENGDQLIVDKLTYRFRDPERYDIIVFPYQYADNTYYIKRVIGMPGETVQIDEEGAIYINGVLLPEHYGREVIASNKLGLAADPITLGKDEYFVLGDNRNNSSDSREPSVGNIRRKDIVGRAWMRIWPLKDFGILKHQ